LTEDFAVVTEPSSGGGELPGLNESSGLSDCLAYAALTNSQLRSAFNKWQAAMEKLLQVRAIPDPKFNYKYYIEEVETRVGPQRQSFGISQTFPWFGKLKLRESAAGLGGTGALLHDPGNEAEIQIARIELNRALLRRVSLCSTAAALL
jgi:hypothetical protein